MFHKYVIIPSLFLWRSRPSCRWTVTYLQKEWLRFRRQLCSASFIIWTVEMTKSTCGWAADTPSNIKFLLYPPTWNSSAPQHFRMNGISRKSELKLSRLQSVFDFIQKLINCLFYVKSSKLWFTLAFSYAIRRT